MIGLILGAAALGAFAFSRHRRCHGHARWGGPPWAGPPWAEGDVPPWDAPHHGHFMTLHFPDEVARNLLSIDVSEPTSGTAEGNAWGVRLTRVAR